MFIIWYKFFIVNSCTSGRVDIVVDRFYINGTVLFRVRMKTESKDTQKDWQEDQGMVHSKQCHKEEDLEECWKDVGSWAGS